MATDEKHYHEIGQYETHAGNYYNGVPFNGSSDQRNTSLVFTSTRTKVNRPDWQQRIAQKLDASNAYDRLKLTRYETAVATNTCQYRQNGTHYVSNGGVIFAPLISATIPSDNILRDQALSRLKNRLASDESQFKSLVPLGELRETRDLLKGGLIPQASGIVKTFLELKHGKLNVVEIRKRAADLWLTWSFGVSPLVAEVNNLANSVDAIMRRTDQVQHYTGSSHKEWAGSLTPHTKFNLTACTGTGYGGVYHSLSYRYTAGIRFRLTSGNNYGLAKHFGLTFGDILPAAWELIPYSWIIDYFTTTGSFFEDTFSSSNGNTIYCTLSRKYVGKYHQSVKFVHPTSSYLQSMQQSSGIAHAEVVALNRSVLTQLPHRAWRFKTLDEIGRNSVNRLLNLTSLLAK